MLKYLPQFETKSNSIDEAKPPTASVQKIEVVKEDKETILLKEIDDLRANIKAKNAEISQLNEATREIDKYKEEIAQVEKMNRLQAEAISANKKGISVTIQAKDVELNLHKKEIENLKLSVQTLQTAKADIEKKLQTLQTDKEKADRQIQTLQATQTNTQTSTDKTIQTLQTNYKSEMSAMSEKYRQEMSAMSEKNKADIADIDRQYKQKATDSIQTIQTASSDIIQTLKIEMSEKDTTLSRLYSEISEKVQKIQTLEKEFSELENSKNTEGVEVQEKLKFLSEENDNLKSQIEETERLQNSFLGRMKSKTVTVLGLLCVVIYQGLHSQHFFADRADRKDTLMNIVFSCLAAIAISLAGFQLTIHTKNRVWIWGAAAVDFCIYITPKEMSIANFLAAFAVAASIVAYSHILQKEL
jgi:chromosome segregation ATPase